MTTITLEGKEYQLDIEQAKKLNLLKEKDNRVRSWDEFKEKYENIEGYTYVTISDCMLTHNSPINTPNQLTPHEATALAAFSKLLKLRRDWIGEWEPDWEDIYASYGVIWVNKNKVQVNTACTLARSLSFPDYKMAKEFLETFHDLIEEAKILI
jgi:hypothetical protein